MGNYRAWAKVANIRELPERRSSTLFDTVAVYLAFTADLLRMEQIRLAVRDDGLTHESPNGHPVEAALDWHDLPAFRDLLICRLLNRG